MLRFQGNGDAPVAPGFRTPTMSPHMASQHLKTCFATSPAMSDRSRDLRPRGALHAFCSWLRLCVDDVLRLTTEAFTFLCG